MMGFNNQGTTAAQPVTNEIKNKGHIVIPYTQGLCESIKKICGSYCIQTHFKGSRIIKSLLVSPKDKDPMVNQSGTIFWYQCGGLGCDDEYIGETSNTWRPSQLFITTAAKQAIPLVTTTLK